MIKLRTLLGLGSLAGFFSLGKYDHRKLTLSERFHYRTIKANVPDNSYLRNEKYRIFLTFEVKNRWQVLLRNHQITPPHIAVIEAAQNLKSSI
jgi:hypothetical protein